MKQSLIKFVNNHLSSLGFTVDDLEEDFHDGVRLILLMGCLEKFFVPLHTYHLSPTTDEQRLENMNLGFKLIEDAGLPSPRNRPYEVVHKDLKSTLRIIYSLFIKYKI